MPSGSKHRREPATDTSSYPGASGNTPQYDVLQWVQHEHDVQHKLCRVLEAIADTLPAPINPLGADAVLVTLRCGLSRYMVIQQRVLFPPLRRRATPEDNIEELIQRISLDNAADRELALDTADQIEAALASGRHPNPDMLSYMLRGVFEGRRRHIAWEAAVLLPLARERLEANDLKPLGPRDISRIGTQKPPA